MKNVIGRRNRPYYEMLSREHQSQTTCPKKKQKEISIVQYCVEREDGRKTWEDQRLLEQCPEVKEMIAQYEADKLAERNAILERLRRGKQRRSNAKKGVQGSFDKGHVPKKVLGLRREKGNGAGDGDIMVKLEWEEVELQMQSGDNLGIDAPAEVTRF